MKVSSSGMAVRGGIGGESGSMIALKVSSLRYIMPIHHKKPDVCSNLSFSSYVEAIRRSRYYLSIV